MQKLFLIDASGYLYRSYFAIQRMTNSKGESTNALFGFVRSLLKLMKDFSPTHLAAIFDGPNNSQSRTDLYAAYKAHRKETPPDLLYQIHWAQKFCRLAGIPELMISGVEADDTLGSIAVWAKETGSEVYLCTSDKDMCQLVNSHVFILNTFKENAILGPKEVKEQYGVFPHQIVDFLAITGDASDNIPGVSGFGPKTASDLLHQFESLDYLLENPQSIPVKKKQETFIAEKENALLSRQLATINKHVAIPQEMDFYKQGILQAEELKAFYQSMNFSSFLRELEQTSSPIRSEPKVEEPSEYILINDEKSLKDLIAHLSTQTEICLDTETTSLKPLEAKLVGIGLGFKPNIAWYIPLNGNMDPSFVLSTLKPFLEGENIGFYGHNLKYDLHVLYNHGIHVTSISFDTLLASYLLHAHSRQHSLDFLTLEYFGKVKIATEELIGKGKKQITMAEVPVEIVSNYCCEDIDYTIRLKEQLTVQLESRGMHELFYSMELPLLPILAEMEENGIFVDIDALKQQATEINKEIAKNAQSVYELAGEEFNLNSPKQLAQILFEKLLIKPSKKSATGFSTNADVLEQLKSEHPIAGKILDYRSLEKLRSTYIEALPSQINPKTGRIHCTFNQSGTATGRLSCQDPNLQNIPVRTAIGKRIREAFRPQKQGYSYLSADYSQIELRLLAHLSEDTVLMQAFLSGEDIHTFTASQIFNIPLEEVTEELRYQAKAVNFGIMYGQQAFGLAQEIGVDSKTAAIFIQKYFERYSKVKTFLQLCKDNAKATGKAVTLYGRERLIPEITSSNGMLRAMAERLAVNTPIQGTQADLIKMAMLEINRRLKESKLQSQMILQIHDELLFECPDTEIETLSILVQEAMTGVIKLKIPLIVDIHVGKNWKEC